VLVNDAWFHGLHDIVDVNKHQLVEIQEFFETYKRLEPHKWAKVKGWKNAAEAKNIVSHAMESYRLQNFEKTK